MILEEIRIQNYRSISNLKIKFTPNKLMVICGANNVGKTNFLRALDLFFSLDLNKFEPDRDIPYQIAEATRGHGYKTQITGKFRSKKGEKIEIKAIFTKKKDKGKVLELKGKKDRQQIKESESRKILNEFRFIFVESSNVDLSKRIAQIVNDDVLLGLDKMRKKQSEPMELLEKFISKSKEALKQIEKDITKILREYTSNIEGIDSSNWKAEILFPEFVGLRDAISNLIHFTLYDTNRRNIDTKGSGIQKIIVLALIKYISERSNKNIIWGIDEPEAFLQPALQKKVCSVIKELSKEIPIIITTHSNHFIDVNDLSNTYLFEGKFEQKEYARRKGEIFYKTETLINDKTGIEKVIAIKRYLGIRKNDNWEVLPFNIIVEGEEDKDYLVTLFEIYQCEVPNILVVGGADKMKGYLQFLNDFVDELDYKAKVVCLLDHDSAGKQTLSSINSRRKNYNFEIEAKFFPRFDGKSNDGYERTVEDLIPPKIIIDQLNKILRKKGYSIIRKQDISRRTLTANDRKKIIDLAEEFIAHRNSDKDRFKVNQEGVKKFICKKACEDILSHKYNNLLLNNQELKSFILSLTGDTHDS